MGKALATKAAVSAHSGLAGGLPAQAGLSSLLAVPLGALAGVALKLALSRDPHATTCNVSRVVLVEPTLSAVAVNGLLACKTPPARRIRVDAAFADDDAQMRRGPAIAAACGECISVIAPDDGGGRAGGRGGGRPWRAARSGDLTHRPGDAATAQRPTADAHASAAHSLRAASCSPMPTPRRVAGVCPAPTHPRANAGALVSSPAPSRRRSTS